MSKQLAFGDIVVVEQYLIGVIVKSWSSSLRDSKPHHEVYVRLTGNIIDYPESSVDRYLVRHKELDEAEIIYQSNGVGES